MRRALVALAATCAAVVVMAGCAPARPLGAVAEPAAAATDTVEFDRSPTPFGNGFVAVRYPDAESAELTFVVTDGNTQWEVHTNPACAGFSVTRVDGKDLLVILDSEASVHEGRLASTIVATAFRTDGTVAWGPVPVAGALSDLGLITTEMLGGALSSAPAAATALSPSTGAAVELPDDERPVRAANGLLATQTQAGVVVRDAASPSAPVLWESAAVAPVGATGPASVATGHEISAGAFLVLEWPTVHGPAFTVHRFIDGLPLTTLPGSPDARTLIAPAQDVAIFTSTTAEATTATAVAAGTGHRWTEDLPHGALPVAVTASEVWFTASTGYLHRSTSTGAFVPTERPAPALALQSGYELRAQDASGRYRLIRSS